MLEKIKEALRIKHSESDNDIRDQILAAKADMYRVGINKVDEKDFLIIQAIKLYVKWQLNFEDDAIRYMLAYEKLRDSLSLCGDYKG